MIVVKYASALSLDIYRFRGAFYAFAFIIQLQVAPAFTSTQLRVKHLIRFTQNASVLELYHIGCTLTLECLCIKHLVFFTLDAEIVTCIEISILALTEFSTISGGSTCILLALSLSDEGIAIIIQQEIWLLAHTFSTDLYKVSATVTIPKYIFFEPILAFLALIGFVPTASSTILSTSLANYVPIIRVIIKTIPALTLPSLQHPVGGPE